MTLPVILLNNQYSTSTVEALYFFQASARVKSPFMPDDDGWVTACENAAVSGWNPGIIIINNEFDNTVRFHLFKNLLQTQSWNIF